MEEKWSDSRHNLKVEPTGFADGLDMEYDRKGGMKGPGRATQKKVKSSAEMKESVE